MGYIKEPAGVEFIVDPTPLTREERKNISAIIAYYKATGRKMLLSKSLSATKEKTARHARKIRRTLVKKKATA